MSEIIMADRELMGIAFCDIDIGNAQTTIEDFQYFGRIATDFQYWKSTGILRQPYRIQWAFLQARRAIQSSLIE